MQVELASGDVLSGIPTVEVDVAPHAIDVTHPASVSQSLTVERTEFLAQDVCWFSIGLP
jgi:hypothetical protein